MCRQQEQQSSEQHAKEEQIREQQKQTQPTSQLTQEVYRLRFTTVEQDSSLLPAKRPPNWQELKIWAAQPGLISFDNVLPQQVLGLAGVVWHLSGILTGDVS
jgi:hypothetical protein